MAPFSAVSYTHLDVYKRQRKQFLGISKAGEVANVVAFLLSDATRTITGTSIVIDGGYIL